MDEWFEFSIECPHCKKKNCKEVYTRIYKDTTNTICLEAKGDNTCEDCSGLYEVYGFANMELNVEKR